MKSFVNIDMDMKIRNVIRFLQVFFQSIPSEKRLPSKLFNMLFSLRFITVSENENGIILLCTIATAN